MAVSELDIKNRLGWPGRHDGNILPVLAGGLHRAVGHHLQLVVLLVGFGVLGAPGATGTGDWGAFDSRFFEDFYKHCEPCVFGPLVGDETWTPPTFFWVLQFDKCPRCVDIWCATWILKDTYPEEVSLLFVVHGGWLSVSWSLATAGEFFSAIVLECSRAIFCRTWIFYRLTGS